MKLPTVSIGLPVYNGARTLDAVIQSLLDQTFTDFELIISDNASTDATAAICVKHAAVDPRIRYIRQEQNLGAEQNFRIVARQARGSYFMWAAADDLRSSDFLAVNVAFLDARPCYLGSTSPVKFRGGDFDTLRMGDESLAADTPGERILGFFNAWHANGRFYSLFRRDVVMSWPHLDDPTFLGSDWTLVTHVASQGKLNRAADGFVELGTEGASHTTDLFARYRRRLLDALVPFWRVSVDTMQKLRGAPLSIRLRVLGRLGRLNWLAFKGQIRVRWLRPQA